MNQKARKFFSIAIHILEYAVAALTLGVLVYLIGCEVYRMFTVDCYFASTDTYLKNILTVVVGLEFVRMLINLTPGNILEVLIVALARQVLINSGDTWGDLICIACIVGLFAVRRFLIKKEELGRELSFDGFEEGEQLKGEENQ